MYVCMCNEKNVLNYLLGTSPLSFFSPIEMYTNASRKKKKLLILLAKCKCSLPRICHQTHKSKTLNTLSSQMTFLSGSGHHHNTKQANPTAATIASALARTMAPGLASGPQQGRL
jgi:hypothetical protein